MVARDVVDNAIHLIGIDIEGCRNAQLQPLPVKVFRYRLTEVSHTNDCHIYRLLAIQDIVDKVYEDLDIVTLLGVARKAYKHKVATHLHSRNAMHASQDVRKDVRDTLRMALK
jgi:hypothetical protein